MSKQPTAKKRRTHESSSTGGNAIIKKISSVIASTKSDGIPPAVMPNCVPLYLARNAPDDLTLMSAKATAATIVTHMALGTTRKNGEKKINIYHTTIDGNERTVINVVCDDMPFLVDSITADVARHGHEPTFTAHPILNVVRKHDTLVAIHPPKTAPEAGCIRESYICIVLRRQPDDVVQEMVSSLKSVLTELHKVVRDWSDMLKRLAISIDKMSTDKTANKTANKTDTDTDTQLQETIQFLQWVYDNHFTFLGFREYNVLRKGRAITLTVNKKSGLGVLDDPEHPLFSRTIKNRSSLSEMQTFVTQPRLLMVMKANVVARVHRRVHMDLIIFKKIHQGKVVGLYVFAGLFTSIAYDSNLRAIPFFRNKIDRVVEKAGLEPQSHYGKVLLHILTTFPRDELFQIQESELLQTAMGIMHLQERPRTALFVRIDSLKRFASCLVYVPREQFNFNMRRKIGNHIAKIFKGRVSAFYIKMDDEQLVRIHYIIGNASGDIPNVNIKKLEATLADMTRSTEERLYTQLHERYHSSENENDIIRLARSYGDAFSSGWYDQYKFSGAVEDIDATQRVMKTGRAQMLLYTHPDEAPYQVHFKLYHPNCAIVLSDALPIFEHMGFRVLNETPHHICPDRTSAKTRSVSHVILHDFELEVRDKSPVNLKKINDIMTDAFRAVMDGEMESDGFNALVCLASLSGRQVMIIRAYAKYLRQAASSYSQTYMAQTMSHNPTIARMLVEMFETQFDGTLEETERTRKAARITATFTRALDEVASADEDKILRRFFNVVTATLRTNYYQVNDKGEHKPVLALKIDSKKVEELPLPCPFREIFIYSPAVEGVHLRFGMVARGGLRWSDRPQDFRTEILGLVKAQQVKNAVIVPVGSKGGFIVKNPPTEGGREAFMKAGIDCYQRFIEGLLDITDNIHETSVLPPKNTVRHDGNDPYLVVAADKGTATFSDIANAISSRYGHWLDDAFASGGSQGYDHKGMGITARGAWECVQRHFREMGTDIQNEDFTVVGIGDMSGDVFGNGMLLSKHIRLQAAFNHLHIFIDPNPDVVAGWKERKRLFDLPRSSWTDYDKKVMSKGSAIYDRTAKSLTLTAEIKALFAIQKDKITPNELLHSILQAPTDLLWFGGIGTYIKAGSENNAAVGDRANDAIRFDGKNVKAKVIGEGANLGLTQLGRIEYALHGGRLNTDAIDNSAGVDCSDHEVNIKILLGSEVSAGNLSPAKRNRLLAQMTDEVGTLVLINNYRQSQALSLMQAYGNHYLEGQARLMRTLEREGLLNRAIEFLPDDETLNERTRGGGSLCRPELAIILSYAKLRLYDQILASDIPDDGAMQAVLIEYFPTPLREKYTAGILQHRLKREIIATCITNDMINRMGATFVHTIKERTGFDADGIMRAYLIAVNILGAEALWQDIESLDNNVSTEIQIHLLKEINARLERLIIWLLKNAQGGLPIAEKIACYKEGMAVLDNNLENVLPAHYRDDILEKATPCIDAGVPKSLAVRVMNTVNLVVGGDIVNLVARTKGLTVPTVAEAYFTIGTALRFGSLRRIAEKLALSKENGHWQRLAIDATLEELYNHQRNITRRFLDAQKITTAAALTKALDNWMEENADAMARARSIIDEITVAENPDIAMLTVVNRQLSALS